MVSSYPDEVLSERIQFARALYESCKEFHNAFLHVFIYSILLLFSFARCERLCLEGCDEGLKWCWSMLVENNKRLLWLRQASDRAYKAGSSATRSPSHILMLWHRLPQPIALVTESRICTSECHSMQICFAACGCMERNGMSGDSKIWHSCQDGMQKLGAIASCPGKCFLLLTGSEIQWEPCTEQGCCQAPTGWHGVSLRGNFSQPLLRSCWSAQPWFGKGESMSIALVCCTCFDYSLLRSSEMELDW